jgi:hypothetical protein|tara:strand:+ start:201 stop:464 length:264 start_codon:yes stop_codon:yes gene_type:complete
MGIVTEKNVITQEELNELQDHLNKSQTLTLELGEIELVKLQLETRYEVAKKLLTELTEKEQKINKAITDKYGKISLDYKTGEYTKID